ncbi:Peptidase [Parasponia andersonii]|uniref:Peptidase n=1 Tax=Parasponia andersonii TaxID=3476 RepID=A0A2P5D3U7_PARAD|nr:Peptidase [Parasponia andersonii]
MAGRGGRARGLLPFLALEAFLQYRRLERKPPITAGLMAANCLIYLRPAFLDSIIPSIDEVWFNPYLILKYKDLRRFFLSPFYHVGEPHLFYNMLSLLWKGGQLENSMPSLEYASMVAALLAMSQGITLLFAKSLLLFFDYEKAYYSEYSVGFSGVLFAMKVVLNSEASNYTDVYGLLVPSRYAAWAELILIQMFVPGVSFLGHLGGILAGVLYLRLKGAFSGPDPLAVLVRTLSQGLTSIVSWPMRVVKELFRRRRWRLSGRGTVGGGGGNRRGTAEPWGMWRCHACTYHNNGLLSICEMCGTSRSGDESVFDPPLSRGSDDHLPLEELRRRRIERFGN